MVALLLFGKLQFPIRFATQLLVLKVARCPHGLEFGETEIEGERIGMSEIWDAPLLLFTWAFVWEWFCAGFLSFAGAGAQGGSLIHNQ